MKINSERFWHWVDIIATECPLCAFGRGMVFGAVLAVVVAWLM